MMPMCSVESLKAQHPRGRLVRVGVLPPLPRRDHHLRCSSPGITLCQTGQSTDQATGGREGSLQGVKDIYIRTMFLRTNRMELGKKFGS